MHRIVATLVPRNHLAIELFSLSLISAQMSGTTELKQRRSIVTVSARQRLQQVLGFGEHRLGVSVLSAGVEYAASRDECPRDLQGGCIVRLEQRYLPLVGRQRFRVAAQAKVGIGNESEHRGFDERLIP